MNGPIPCALPEGALLGRHVESGNYTDCYRVDLDEVQVGFADYVQAFYTTRLFKLERWILRWLVRRPSTDAQVAELARGQREDFAAWTVEARAPAQLLLCDLYGRTRSWLMLAPTAEGSTLYFGSAVVARRDPRTGARSMGWTYRALLGFHKLYSRLLLSAAVNRLLDQPKSFAPPPDPPEDLVIDVRDLVYDGKIDAAGAAARLRSLAPQIHAHTKRDQLEQAIAALTQLPPDAPNATLRGEMLDIFETLLAQLFPGAPDT